MNIGNGIAVAAIWAFVAFCVWDPSGKISGVGLGLIVIVAAGLTETVSKHTNE